MRQMDPARKAKKKAEKALREAGVPEGLRESHPLFKYLKRKFLRRLTK